MHYIDPECEKDVGQQISIFMVYPLGEYVPVYMTLEYFAANTAEVWPYSR